MWMNSLHFKQWGPPDEWACPIPKSDGVYLSHILNVWPTCIADRVLQNGNYVQCSAPKARQSWLDDWNLCTATIKKSPCWASWADKIDRKMQRLIQNSNPLSWIGQRVGWWGDLKLWYCQEEIRERENMAHKLYKLSWNAPQSCPP